ncbi:hypothetical protein KAS79_00860 [Candidatus Parcubacteria bacterium]|nr:hypothetical protein [Candidatus Parcubacteria bacterium]
MEENNEGKIKEDAGKITEGKRTNYFIPVLIVLSFSSFIVSLGLLQDIFLSLGTALFVFTLFFFGPMSLLVIEIANKHFFERNEKEWTKITKEEFCMTAVWDGIFLLLFIASGFNFWFFILFIIAFIVFRYIFFSAFVILGDN